jgi:hypothetical protein
MQMYFAPTLDVMAGLAPMGPNSAALYRLRGQRTLEDGAEASRRPSSVMLRMTPSPAPREKGTRAPSLAKREKVGAGWRPDEGRRNPLTKVDEVYEA